MMKVVCSSCKAEYRIDPGKISGPRSWFKCRSCSQIIRVELPAEEPLPPEDDILSQLSADFTPATDHGGEAESGGDDPLESLAEDQARDIPSAEPISSPSVQADPGRKYRIGLTDKVIFFMLIVSLIPGGIFFALSSKSAHDRILAETDRTGVLVTMQLASRVDEWIDKNVRALNAFAKLPHIQGMNPLDQESALISLQQEYPWMYLAFTTDVRGHNIARSDGKPLKNYSDRQYVRDIAGGRELTWQNLIGKTSKKPALILAVPIKNNGRVTGVLAAAMTREAISQGVTRLKLGRTGASFLVDQTGKVVAHQNNAYVLNQRNMGSHPLVAASQSGKQESIVFRDADGSTVIGFTRTTRLGWILAVQQDREEALEPLKAARTQALILLAATLVIVLFIAFFASRTIVRPIRELTHAANQISVGDLDVNIRIRSKDEIGDLAQAVTRLQDSVQLSISRLKRMRK